MDQLQRGRFDRSRLLEQQHVAVSAVNSSRPSVPFRGNPCCHPRQNDVDGARTLVLAGMATTKLALKSLDTDYRHGFRGKARRRREKG
jgi:hypothetical protein